MTNKLEGQSDYHRGYNEGIEKSNEMMSDLSVMMGMASSLLHINLSDEQKEDPVYINLVERVKAFYYPE